MNSGENTLDMQQNSKQCNALENRIEQLKPRFRVQAIVVRKPD